MALALAEVTAEDQLGNDITNAVIQGTPEIIDEEQKIKFYVKGGSVGLRADIKIVATMDDNVDPDLATTYVDYVVMLVKN